MNSEFLRVPYCFVIDRNDFSPGIAKKEKKGERKARNVRPLLPPYDKSYDDSRINKLKYQNNLECLQLFNDIFVFVLRISFFAERRWGNPGIKCRPS